MDYLNRSFHARGIVVIPWLMVATGLIVGSAWLATGSAVPQFLSNIVFYLGVTCLLATLHLFLYRLDLETTSDAFVVTVRFLSATMYRRETRGLSWRPVATPANHADEPSSGRYRVDAFREDGTRQVALGSLMCFAFGVDCL